MHLTTKKDLHPFSVCMANNKIMKHLNILLVFFLTCCTYQINAQNSKDNNYIEFNDRKNIVHGVYLGANINYGEIDNKDTSFFGFKVAYVANRKFEVGLSLTGFYSQQNLQGILNSNNEDLVGGYAGIHLEPILFSTSRINLSFPLLVGSGAVGYIDGDFEGNTTIGNNNRDLDIIFVLEPGISILYNVSRYIQLETGVKYRLSSKFNVLPSGPNRINGYSVGLGIKVGVFNLGRNRYKKSIPNHE